MTKLRSISYVINETVQQSYVTRRIKHPRFLNLQPRKEPNYESIDDYINDNEARSPQ